MAQVEIYFESPSASGLAFEYSENTHTYRWNVAKGEWIQDKGITRVTMTLTKNQGSIGYNDRYTGIYRLPVEQKNRFIEGCKKMHSVSVRDEKGEEISFHNNVRKTIFLTDLSVQSEIEAKYQKSITDARIKVSLAYDAETLQALWDMAFMAGVNPVNKTADEIFSILSKLCDNNPSMINNIQGDLRALVEVALEKAKSYSFEGEPMVRIEEPSNRVYFFNEQYKPYPNMNALIESLLNDEIKRDYFFKKVAENDLKQVEKFTESAGAKKEAPKAKKEKPTTDSMPAVSYVKKVESVMKNVKKGDKDAVDGKNEIVELTKYYLASNIGADIEGACSHIDKISQRIFEGIELMDWQSEKILSTLITIE